MDYNVNNKEGIVMYVIVDILMLAFVALLLYRGIKYGFLNRHFSLVTAILWIVLGIGASALLVLFVLRPLGVMQDASVAFRGAGEGLYSFMQSLGIEVALPEIEAINLSEGISSTDLTPYIIAQYIAYLLAIIIFFIPLYIFFLWVGRKFEQFIDNSREKHKVYKIIDSTLGGIVGFALSAVIVLGVYWIIGALDGSGLFTYTNEVLRAAPISGAIYENNPLYSILGGHGALAEAVKSIISGDFLVG